MLDTCKVPEYAAGKRIDVFLHELRPELSRSRWQELIKEGCILLNRSRCKTSTTLKGGEEIEIEIPPPRETELVPEEIPLAILYEDADLLAIDKPAGMVVHPAPGHPRGTLVNALIHHCSDLKGIGGELRPGIVHRLDKDTSGVVVVAKTEQAMVDLSDQFKARKTRKEYLALVRGIPVPAEGEIETEIGRSRHDRKRMSVSTRKGRYAFTRYEVQEELDGYSLLKVRIETGRTHQIRVHLAHIGHPVMGDPVYGGKRAKSTGLPIPRQMLHARKLVFTHPTTRKKVTCTAPIPPDMAGILDQIRHS